jgi:hypothetical protein
MPDTTARRFFEAMSQSIARDADLLAVVLPRVAPEQTVVALATRGLVDAIGDGGRVELEAKVEGVKRCDVVVKTEQTYCFEWKLLWPNGIAECVEGVQKDLRKLRKARGPAYAVAFAYALSKVPKGCEAWLAKKTTLDQLLRHRRVTGLGQPEFRSEAFAIDAHGCGGEAYVAAWRAEGARPRAQRRQ